MDLVFPYVLLCSLLRRVSRQHMLITTWLSWIDFLEYSSKGWAATNMVTRLICQLGILTMTLMNALHSWNTGQEFFSFSALHVPHLAGLEKHAQPMSSACSKRWTASACMQTAWETADGLTHGDIRTCHSHEPIYRGSWILEESWLETRHIIKMSRTGSFGFSVIHQDLHREWGLLNVLVTC